MDVVERVNTCIDIGLCAMAYEDTGGELLHFGSGKRYILRARWQRRSGLVSKEILRYQVNGVNRPWGRRVKRSVAKRRRRPGRANSNERTAFACGSQKGQHMNDPDGRSRRDPRKSMVCRKKQKRRKQETRIHYCAATGLRRLLLRDLGFEGAKSESGTLCQPVTSGIG